MCTSRGTVFYFDLFTWPTLRGGEREKGPEDPPAKLLDDLFRKTKAAPCIYWLPLTEEQAKVVKSFNECNQFFYKGKEPQGMNQNAKKICQKLQYDDFLYATLYSTFNKIPLYSAYKFDPKCSGETQIQCSPQYSLITAEGNRCRDDHPCATYGKDYYWCFTDKESWQYCSPPLWGSRAKDGKYCRSDYACAKYNKTNPWCYTDDKNWSYCCTSDDYFSAVNYKTCKPDHPCGYHGKDYLWCHTTDGNWNYCCKEFKI
ncbi:endonuclease domain-containing 1 -like protein [Labeo rohita]|uniref:Endonuclease domain-containing 1-like protein n=1 Tax=Labeo rohita TaxID=84645 RepID=A0A498MLS9_LABRO|nr:endonuclease domain-containing 1 -like protein [Labeo rohita]